MTFGLSTTPLLYNMASAIPKFYRKLVATSVTHNFRQAVQLKTVESVAPGPKELLVRTRYVGINASEINLTAGRYTPGIQPPFDTGMEGAGTVAAVGSDCGGQYKPGDAVCFMHMGAFSEYVLLPVGRAVPLPSPQVRPEYLPLILSGTTASISLELMGELRPGETVLVTAAAGGTGQFAVQLAKLAGCHVIGTCSNGRKVEFLRKLGCDRPINYKREDFGAVLKAEYPQGVDVVYESVGGDMFNTCVKNLAIGGRLIIIGFVSGYQQSSFAARTTLPLFPILLSKSASVRGFFLNNHVNKFATHLKRLSGLLAEGKLQSVVDMGESSPEGPFKGIASIFRAVDYLYSQNSAGKVVVDLSSDDPLSKM